MAHDRASCTCASCQRACAAKPGWFLPGEAEKAAAHLGLSLPDFFHRSLMADYFARDEEDTLVLSPAVTSGVPGTKFPWNPLGRCVFFQDGRCQIHAVKPFECAQLLHDDTGETVHARHTAAAAAWEAHQAVIRDLLGSDGVH